MNQGRNDLCSCGSGRKYEECCARPAPGLPLQSGQQQAFAAAPESAARALLDPAELSQFAALFNAGQYAELEKRACSLLERHPDSGIAWKILSIALLTQGKDAEPALQNAARLLSDDAEVHYNLGNTLRKLGRPDDAEASYRRALQVKPDYAAAHVNMGNLVLEQGRLEEAEASYRRALTIRTDLAEVHYNLGNILHGLGRQDEAEASYRQALRIRPVYAEAHGNLGNTLYDQGRLEESETCYRQALRIRPDYAEAYSNLGNVLYDLGRLEESEASCRHALRLRPDYAEAHYNLANTLLELGRLEESEASYRRALQIRPDYADVYGALGKALRKQGRLDEALACFQQQVRLMPEDGEAQHQVASLIGSNTERAPDQYVESVFDSYADGFDTHLQQTLGYEAPGKLAALVARHLLPSAEKWNVLDLGCGTGLVGLAIAPFVRELVGVDLSARMLEKARERNLYQRLERLDLLTMMRDEKASSYDVIIAADVFVYIGKLDEIVVEIKRLLRPGGVFAFTVEDLVVLRNGETSQGAQREYQLENTGRYTHSADYITRLASAHGLLLREMVAAQIRKESGKPVNSYLVLWENRVEASMPSSGY